MLEAYAFMDLAMSPYIRYEGQRASEGTEGIFSSVKMNILSCHVSGVYKTREGLLAGRQAL